MTFKRFGKPRANTGQLKAKWGKLPHNNPDLCYIWGDGINRGDAALLHYMFSGKRAQPLYGEDEIKANGGDNIKWAKSLLEELEERGYDITTFEFSIKKKEPK